MAEPPKDLKDAKDAKAAKPVNAPAASDAENKPEQKQPDPPRQQARPDSVSTQPKPDSKQEKIIEGVKKAEMKGDVRKIERLIGLFRRNSLRVASSMAKAGGAAKPLAPAQQQSIVGLRDISIVLDTYDDIFSDFDPRPYSQRALSDDFLKEIRARYRENKAGGVEVHFILPERMRDQKTEAVVRRRLREYFAFEAKSLGETLNGIRRKGIAYTFIGAVFLAAQIGLAALFKLSTSQSDLLSILLVPAGWYGMFAGIEKLIETPFDISSSIKIANKFERAEYTFMSQPESAQQQERIHAHLSTQA